MKCQKAENAVGGLLAKKRTGKLECSSCKRLHHPFSPFQHCRFPRSFSAIHPPPPLCSHQA